MVTNEEEKRTLTYDIRHQTQSQSACPSVCLLFNEIIHFAIPFCFSTILALRSRKLSEQPINHEPHHSSPDTGSTPRQTFQSNPESSILSSTVHSGGFVICRRVPLKKAVLLKYMLKVSNGRPFFTSVKKSVE